MYQTDQMLRRIYKRRTLGSVWLLDFCYDMSKNVTVEGLLEHLQAMGGKVQWTQVHFSIE